MVHAAPGATLAKPVLHPWLLPLELRAVVRLLFGMSP